MCNMCDERNNGPAGCPECGRLICFDYKGCGDDVMGKAVVTSSGDVMCLRCCERWEIEEERMMEEEASYYPNEDF